MNILITGGASGLGEAITKAFAKEPGNTVYFTYNASVSNVKELEREFGNVKPLKCDFKNAAEVNALRDKIPGLDPDILVNNAYCSEPIKTHFHKIAAEDFLNDFNHNIIPTILITQACIAEFRKKKSGKIITVLTSYLLNLPPIGSSVYVANKAYLASLVKSWAAENSKFNIMSYSVSPSFMKTNFTKDVDERMIEQIRESHPLKKLLTVSEAADAVLLLATSTSHLNGTDIPVNAV